MINYTSCHNINVWTWIMFMISYIFIPICYRKDSLYKNKFKLCKIAIGHAWLKEDILVNRVRTYVCMASKWSMLNKQDVKVIRFIIFNFKLFDKLNKKTTVGGIWGAQTWKHFCFQFPFRSFFKHQDHVPFWSFGLLI